MKKLYAAVMLVALCIFSFTAYAQQKEVTGKVSDVNGEPLAGVTVLLSRVVSRRSTPTTLSR